MLERLTLALREPEQIRLGAEAKELVGVLECLTLALKAPQRESTGNGVKALPADTSVEDGKAE